MTIRIKTKDEGSIDYLVYIHVKFFFFFGSMGMLIYSVLLGFYFISVRGR